MQTGNTRPCKNDRPDHSLNRSVHEFFEDQVELTPDAPLMTMGLEQLSYRDVNSRSNRLARFLVEHGVGPGSLVGVYLDRSFDTLVSLLALLKCGGTYVPLDPRFPKDRLEFMVTDAQISHLLTHAMTQGSLQSTKARIILLDREEESIAKVPAANLAPNGGPEQLAYLIYTSGSTGKPKGVMIPRRALVNLLLSMAETPGIHPSDVLLAVTPTSFDISILELLLPLMCGAQFVMTSAEQAADGRQLQELLRRHAVTVMQATPATWRMLVDSGWEGKDDLRILCGGEALTPDLARKLLPRCRELWNMYGPTETTIWSSTERIASADHISLGLPIANTQLCVFDENRNPVSVGMPGELWIGGTGLALGYLNRPELTAEKFVIDTMTNSHFPDGRLYRTGDEVRVRPDGTLEFLGRLDHQVKLNGFRIELGEIECALTDLENIEQAIVVLREDRPGDKRLVAYYTGSKKLNSSSGFQSLRSKLPDYMIPSVFSHLEKFPLTPNGKIDRKALPQPGAKRPLLAHDFIAPQTAIEKRLTSLWCELLELEEIGIDDSFFDLGGTSLMAIRMVSQYHTRFGYEIPAVKVFQHPTIAKLGEYLEGSGHEADFLFEAESRSRHQRHPRFGADSESESARDGVALIGMSGRFPGAANLDQLWKNLRNSVESISLFKPEELGPGIEEHLRNDPDYVRARGLIEGADLFDASFFGISPLEAKIMDPQQRVFLELAQHALENAGYDPERYEGRIGVFAGIGDNHYYTTNLLTRPDLLALAGKLAVEYGNQKDYIALRTAYLLDLRGPAVSLNTACSTTLLVVDQAYRSLLHHECDIALCGGVDITVPQKSGFLYQEGGTFAKDGHCRPFDAEATGTMFCDGAGVVILKRLANALADGDTIYSVIRGSAKNNNGARPASFLAPSVEGQAEVIAMAQADANVPIESIRYIEAHGTGTPVGDPIEVEALRKVFEHKTSRRQFCYIGSIKGNIGHPTNAAGVAGLIKTALALHNEEIPPTLHFKVPNPKIDFKNSPFLIADKLIPFPRGEEIRRAAVSSFGFGGTNVHVILEEAPAINGTRSSRPRQLCAVSAKSQKALGDYSQALEEYLADGAPETFADAAFTLQVGRKQMAHRRFVVAGEPAEAAKLLAEPNPLRCGSKLCERRNPPIVFLFGGQGTQYVNMGLNLYQSEPLFRAIVDDCCEQLKPHLGRDLREILYPPSGDEKTAQISLQDTLFTQPSIFVIEYALARFWESLGVSQAMMAGHSIGEFVAATLAGVWELEDVLSIVALRGKLMQDLPRGSMMAVSISPESLAKTLPATLQIASINAPNLCVVSGTEQSVDNYQKQLEAEGVACRRLHTSHAFHSAMMDPIIEPLRDAVAKINLRAPAKTIVSTVTGRAMTDIEATDPAYWARHARATVEFGKAIRFAKDQGHDLFLECGPRSTMCSLARKQFTSDRPCTAIPTFSDTSENNTEWGTLLFAVGSLWLNGVQIDWEGLYAHEDRRRIPLPVYPFERQRFWVDPAPVVGLGHDQRGYSEPIAGAQLEMSPKVAGSSTAIEDIPLESVHQSRKDQIASRVVDLLIPVSGRERSQISLTDTFMEQGFDSLSLTQVAFALQKEFSVRISFSQLMNRLPNVDLLASHLDTTIPRDNPDINSPGRGGHSNVSAHADAPNAGDQTNSSTLEQVVAEQAHTIARLVALLGETSPIQSSSAKQASPDAGLVIAFTEQHDDRARRPSTIYGVLETESTVPQRGIFASSCLSKHLSASYNESMTVRFTGAISVERMSRAMNRLVERHDALRASFDESGRTMKINRGLKIAMPVTDLSAIESLDSGLVGQEEHLRKLIADEMDMVFSLPAGPLFRCQMILLGQDRAAVILTAHHIICDGWSLDVLIHDLCAFYAEEISGEPVCLEERQSYLAYARSVTERQRAHEFEEAGNYWREKFTNGFPVIELPADFARAARREFRARRLDYTVSAELVQGLRLLAAKNGCSFFAVLLSSLAILLARVSKQLQFVIALPTAEQPVNGQPGLVGHCVNLLPFAVELRGGETVSDFLKRVQNDLVAAQEHSIFTMVSLLEDLHSIAHTIGVSAISAGFTNVKKFKPNELPQAGFAVDYEANPKSYESFEIYLNAVEIDEGLEFHCHYDVNLFDDLTIRAWLESLDSICHDLTTDPTKFVVSLVKLAGEDDADSGETVYVRVSHTETALQYFKDKAGSDLDSLHRPPFSSGKPRLTEAEIIKALLPIWQRVLDIRKIGPDDEFFTLGGHSIAAAQLFALIERELGYVAPLAMLYDASTPRLLAKSLSRGDKMDDWRPLVAINRCGDRPPLFLVHAAEGNVLLYRSLAAHLGIDQPVFGLQSAGLDGRFPIDARFENVARRYVDEIREIQPHGPYMLGGYCLGGTIALEMAQQLIALGETVGLVAMIEDFNIRSIRWPLSLRDRMVNRLFLNPYFHLRNLLAAEGGGKLDFFAEKLRVALRRVRVSHEVGVAGLRHRFLPKTGPAVPQARLSDIYDEALSNYDIRPYPGELTLFMPDRHLAGFGDRLGGWGEVAQGGVRLYSLPFSPRGSLIEPYVEELASNLRECLDRALANSMKLHEHTDLPELVRI
jgi:amino acid adenylation domain-containing protein